MKRLHARSVYIARLQIRACFWLRLDKQLSIAIMLSCCSSLWAPDIPYSRKIWRAKIWWIVLKVEKIKIWRILNLANSYWCTFARTQTHMFLCILVMYPSTCRSSSCLRTYVWVSFFASCKVEVYELEGCVRGHHFYGRVWRATVDEQLECKPEPRNQDPYTVAVLKNDAVVGHVPRKYWLLVLCS